MKRLTVLLIVFLITMICYAAALSARRRSDQQNDRPEWLVNPQSRYPSGMYLVAIGEGDNRQRAESDAAANLARIFETRVETEELFEERYKEIVSDDIAQADILTTIDRSISLSASQTLYNIQYADSYTDDLGRVYVLAYIDRHQTADIYMNKIENHNDQIMLYLNQAEVSDNKMKQYAYKSAAAVISVANENLLEQLQIIAPDYKAMLMLDYDHNELVLQTRQLAQELKFNISLANDRENKLHSVLADLLTGHGFLIDEQGDITIEGEILLEDVDLQRQEEFVRWHLNLNLQDDKEQNILTHSQRGREGHISHSEAVARAFRAMEREIRQEFNRKLFSYFDNLVK